MRYFIGGLLIFFFGHVYYSWKNGNEWFHVARLLTHIYTKCLLNKVHRFRILCHLRETSSWNWRLVRCFAESTRRSAPADLAFKQYCCQNIRSPKNPPLSQQNNYFSLLCL